MIKAVFFDVDGTLLSHRTKQVPESARQSLNKLKENGIKIFLSTGRHPLELEELPLDDILFDGYITLTGQLCLDHEKKALFRAPFDRESTQELVSIFHQREIPLMLVEEDRFYINFINDIVRNAQQNISTSMPLVEEYKNGLVYQATTFLSPEEERVFRERLPKSCKFTRWSDYGVDIISTTGGKVSGIKYIQELFHISTDEIMAFGDEENDIDMLEYAGIGIAMGNAKESVKKIADFVTDDIDQDGIRNALYHFHVLSKYTN